MGGYIEHFLKNNINVGIFDDKLKSKIFETKLPTEIKNINVHIGIYPLNIIQILILIIILHLLFLEIQ